MDGLRLARQFSEETATLSQRDTQVLVVVICIICPSLKMSKSDRCSSCRVLLDAFADQFHSCLLILLVLSPPHTTSHHRHHKYQLAQNMSELYQSCVFTDVKTNMSLKTDTITQCLLSFLSSFSPFSSVVLLQCSIPLLHFQFLPFTFTLSPIMFILTVSNSVMSLRRHIQLP